MIKKRAIYTGDIGFDTCIVFELDKKSKMYVCLTDTELMYPKKVVEEEDDDFLLFRVNSTTKHVTFQNKNKE